MTFSYSSKVSSVKLLGLARLLSIWRASVYKLVFREILIFLVLYIGVSCIYRFALNARQQNMFERLVIYSATSESLMPVTFVLGFYVSVVVQRWWSQFMSMGWPDRIMAYISVLVTGKDAHSTMMRRTMIRYLMLSEVLLLMNISAPVKRRFPNLESLVKQGLMTKAEMDLFNDDTTPKIGNKFWMPCQWCAVLLGRARAENKIRHSFELIKLLEELTEFKVCLRTMFCYDWLSLPLVYTQVATIAVYAFFFTAVISRQYISYENVRLEFDNDTSARYAVDMYLPFEAIMQLFFYLGWLKVAEQMLNPFGEDDDDFECNFIIDRNLQVGLYAVDKMLAMQPKLQRDAWWDSDDPKLDYTEASKKFAMTSGWFGSTADLTVPEASSPMGPRLPSIPETPSVGTDLADLNGSADEAAPEVAANFGHRKFSKYVPRRRSATSTSPSSVVNLDAAGHRSSRLRRKFGSTPDTRTGGGVASAREADSDADTETDFNAVAAKGQELSPLVGDGPPADC